MKKLLLAAFAGLLSLAPAFAQQLPAGSWPLGRGTGSGFYASQGPYIDVTAPPYNATLDGTTDDTAAIQAAIAAATGKSQTVWFPCVNNNVAVISSTLELGRGVNLATCEGGTNQGYVQFTGVRLKWTGGSDVPMVKFWGAVHSSLRGFTLDCNSSVDGSNGRIGIQYASANNPATSYNTIDNITVLNCHQGLVVGSPAMEGPPGGTCVDFTLLYCAQADSLTLSRFNVKGNGNDVTASGIHLNSGNGLQSSHLYQGNIQAVSVGIQIIYSNGGAVWESFNPGNMVGEKTFVKIGTDTYKYQYGPHTWIHMETEGSLDYAWRDLSDLNEGITPAYRYAHKWIESAWNNPVSCEGNGRIISMGSGGGGIGNPWVAGGGCQILSMYDATNTPTTAPSPWTTDGTEARITAFGSMNTRTVVQSDNLIAGALPSGISIGVGNLSSSRGPTSGRVHLGSDGVVYIDRDGAGQGVNIVGAYLGAGAAPGTAAVGDLYTSRSSTAGAVLFGGDGNKYMLRSGNQFQIVGAPLQILVNQGSIPAVLTGTNFQVEGTNATDSRIQNDAFGGSAYVSLSRSNGTGGSPTVVASGNQIGGFNFFGYDGTNGALAGPTASFRAVATQTWSAGSNGTYAEIATTPNGSATMAGVMRFEHNGGITVPSTVTGGNMGAGTINAAGFYINGVSIGAPASMTANTVLGNATGSTAAPTNLAMPSCSASASALIWTTSTGFGCSTTLAALNVVQTFTADQSVVGANLRVGSASAPLLNSSVFGISNGTSGNLTQSGSLGIQNIFNITGGAADQKIWDLNCSTSACSFRAVNDAYSAAQNAWTATRGSGATIASVNIGQGVFTVTDATDTTSTSTGSLRTAGGIAAAKAITAGTGGYRLASTLMVSSTAPTIASGFCTSPTVPNANGTAAFTINVGTGCAGSSGVITMPTAATGWVCNAVNVTNPATNVVEQSAGTTTSVTLTNYVRTTGVAGNFTASDVLRLQCTAY